MKEYIEYRLAFEEVKAMGYAIGINWNPKTQDCRAIAAYPGVGVKPWAARGVTPEQAFMRVYKQLKTGVRDEK